MRRVFQNLVDQNQPSEKERLGCRWRLAFSRPQRTDNLRHNTRGDLLRRVEVLDQGRHRRLVYMIRLRDNVDETFEKPVRNAILVRILDDELDEI